MWIAASTIAISGAQHDDEDQQLFNAVEPLQMRRVLRRR
jgi:hypothetical protein